MRKWTHDDDITHARRYKRGCENDRTAMTPHSDDANTEAEKTHETKLRNALTKNHARPSRKHADADTNAKKNARQ